MPRYTRRLGNSGIYHVMLRGINRQDIFDDEDDYHKMVSTLKRYVKTTKSRIHAYCLMSNHVHLLVQAGAPNLLDSETLGQIMKRIEVCYARYYNDKYNRIGTLFQERYKSEAVDSDAYFLTVLRYIHRNPVNAGIVKTPIEYKWSSYHAYVNLQKPDFVYTKLGCEMLGKQFVSYMNDDEKALCIDIDEPLRRITDLELSKLIDETLGIPASYIPLLTQKERDDAIKEIATIKGITCQQISRVTKVPTSTISRIL